MTISTTPSASVATSAPRASRAGHLVSGLLPWLGVLLFVAHASTVVSRQPDGWRGDVVQLGVTYLIGVAGLGAGIAHLFFGRKIARSIGWQTSPFQWEVGCANAALGLAALQASSYGRQYWLALILASGLYRVGCGIGHIREIVRHRNFAINNTAILFLNFVVPVFLFLLWQAWA
jgi:hypothetical protein